MQTPVEPNLKSGSRSGSIFSQIFDSGSEKIAESCRNRLRVHGHLGLVAYGSAS